MLPEAEAHRLPNALFYECYGSQAELLSSQNPEDDFRRIEIFEQVDESTVVLHLTVTGVDYLVFDWYDLRYEPTFLLVVIPASDALKPQRLLVQNSPERQTAVAIAIDSPKPSDARAFWKSFDDRRAELAPK